MTSLIKPIKKIAQLIVCNNLYPKIKKVKYLKKLKKMITDLVKWVKNLIN